MPLPPRAVLVTGSRHWPVDQKMRAEGILGVIIEHTDFVIHGGAPHDRDRPDTVSIDALADKLADELGCKKKIVRPDYAKFRGRERAAPMARNSTLVEILDRAKAAGWDTLCIALIHRQSPGSTDCSSKALRAGHPVKAFTTDHAYVPRPEPQAGQRRDARAADDLEHREAGAPSPP